MGKTKILQMGNDQDGYPRILFQTDVGTHRINSKLILRESQIMKIDIPLYKEVPTGDFFEMLNRIK